MKHLLQKTKNLSALLALTTLLLLPGMGWGQTEEIIYATGFESDEGFTASTTYNNTTVKYDGPDGQQWGTYYGTPSNTSPIAGAQSMQMRWYTAASSNIGYTFTNFELENVTNVSFKAKNTTGINVIVSYSTDGGASYAGDQTFILSTTAETYNYIVSETGEFPLVRIKFQIIYTTAPTVTSRLYIDDVTISGMTGGTPTAVAPTFSPAAGTYYTPQNVTLSTTTEGATIYYTTDGTNPDNTVTEYTAPIAVSSTTTIKAIAYAIDYDPSAIATAVYTFPTINEVANIAALRAITLPSTEVYKLTGEAVLTYKTANRNAKYIQDATGAILIDDNAGIITTSYNLYDGITGITGTLALYNSMLQFTPVTDPGAATSTGNTVTPVEVTLANLTTDYQGKLVKVLNTTISETGNFAASTNYTLTDGSKGTGVLRTQYSDLDYIGQPIPEIAQDLTGVVLQYATAMQLVPRSTGDFSTANIPWPVTFYVDMSNHSDFTTVDIAGSFNNWGNPVQNMMLVDNGIYSLTTEAIFNDGDVIQFKFRKDGSWDTAEGGDNRLYTVIAGTNEYFGVYDIMQPASINWANLQYPATGTIDANGNLDVYARVYMDGVTQPASGSANITAWIGYSTENSNPNTWTNWVPASFNVQVENNDEYKATLTGIPAGTYYYASRFQYLDLGYVYGGYNGGFWDGTNNVSGVLTVNEVQIDWANLQSPASGFTTVGGTFNVYAQVYEPGVTPGEGQGAGIQAWIGYSTSNTDPSTWTNWVSASHNPDVIGNNDEYVANIATGLAQGTYYYASRFQLDAYDFVYGGYNEGGGGFWDGTDNVSGVLTVNAPPMPNAWINEFHYDNDGVDVNEFVEVVVENASGVNLAELRVHLYNGNGGVVYGTSSINDYTEGVTLNGFTIYTLAISGIQNGSPDGLALSYFNILISGQFLSYEGTFEATGGPAIGVTSVDIGVSENGTGATTNSLQLGGAGTEYSDFFWQPEATNTMGLVNNNQSFFTSTIWNGNVSTAWELSVNWSQGVPVQGMDVIILDVNNSPVISLHSACDNLTISPSASLEISSTGSLTVGGDLVTNDGLTVQSGGSLITEGTVTGNATVIRDIAGLNQYHFLSSPITNAALGDVFPSGDIYNIYLREYDEPSGDWVNLTIPATLDNGKGYSFFMDNIAATTATFTGALNNTNVIPAVSNQGNSGNSNYDGWNLLGNPFASAIQWGMGEWVPNNVNNEVHVWSNGVYKSYVNGAGTLTDGIIPAQQGFFVKATTSELPVSVTIPTAARLHSSQAFYKNSIANLLRLDVSGNANEYSDAAFVRFHDEASIEFDAAWDAHKLDNDAAAPMLYTMNGETRFSINALKSVSESPVIPVYFKAGANGEYTINASGMESFDNGVIYLTDNVTGLRQDLNQNPVYTFSATTGDDVSRFTLSFGTLGIEEQSGLNIGVYAANSEIRLQLPEAMRGTVNVTSLSGQVLLSRSFDAIGELAIRTQLPTGIYLVTVITEKGTATRKVFIN
ncbi:MAG: chitobiase/beta-hexosaminidase C-terminal domain-containing protein [Lentimicrobium sp.]|nr:chitobiase/beta-hexosaminidase C-terminal domain-containing protein [Lentimicrobium sp.]